MPPASFKNASSVIADSFLNAPVLQFASMAVADIATYLLQTDQRPAAPG